ncbi:MAG: MFS transporter [bacterium]
MTHALSRNLRLYPWYLSLTWEGLSNAVWYLYLFSFKGLSLGEMAWLTLLGDGVIVLAEVPTGWIADRIGRRRSILIGIICQAASSLLFIAGNDFWTFWLAMAVCGLGDTFRSGADQALLYDSCRGLGREGDFRRLLSRSLAIATLAMVAGQILGGSLALRVGWTVPFWGELLLSSCGFIVVMRMLEAPYIDQHDEAAGAGSTAPLGLSLLRLLPLLLFAGAVELAPELAHFHLPAELDSAMAVTTEQLGFMYAGFELLQGFGNWLAGHLRIRRPLRVLGIATLGLVAGLLLMGLRGWLGLLAYIAGRALIDLLTGLITPLLSEQANLLSGSGVRATALSMLNALQRLLPISLLPLSVSLLQDRDAAWMYGCFSLAMLFPAMAGLGWLVMRRRLAGRTS